MIAAVAAVMLESCGFEVPAEYAMTGSEGEEGGAEAGSEKGEVIPTGPGAKWGWAVAKSLLLAASPADARRSELAALLDEGDPTNGGTNAGICR